MNPLLHCLELWWCDIMLTEHLMPDHVVNRPAPLVFLPGQGLEDFPDRAAVAMHPDIRLEGVIRD